MAAKTPPKRPKLKKAPPKPPPCFTLSEDDAAAIEQLCKSLDYEEIAFESWQNSLNNLDLTVPLWVPSEVASEGGHGVVRFSRTIGDAAGVHASRESCTLEVLVPAGSKEGQRLIIPEQGDRSQGKNGNLIVLIRIKR